MITTSSGRLGHKPTVNASKAGKSDETKDDNDISVQVLVKRIKIHDVDRCLHFLIKSLIYIFKHMHQIFQKLSVI